MMYVRYREGVALTHRMQVLLDQAQVARLERIAKAEGRSMGSLIREAIDRAWIDPSPGRSAASADILAAEAMDVPDVPALRAELAEALDERFA